MSSGPPYTGQPLPDGCAVILLSLCLARSLALPTGLFPGHHHHHRGVNMERMPVEWRDP